MRYGMHCWYAVWIWRMEFRSEFRIRLYRRVDESASWALRQRPAHHPRLPPTRNQALKPSSEAVRHGSWYRLQCARGSSRLVLPAAHTCQLAGRRQIHQRECERTYLARCEMKDDEQERSTRHACAEAAAEDDGVSWGWRHSQSIGSLSLPPHQVRKSDETRGTTSKTRSVTSSPEGSTTGSSYPVRGSKNVPGG